MRRLKSPGLGVKMTLTLLILSLSSVALSGGLAVYLLRSQFTSYVQTSHSPRLQSLSELISDTYSVTKSWDVVGEQLSRLGPGVGNRLEIYDLSGGLVASVTRGPGMGMGMGSQTSDRSPMYDMMDRGYSGNENNISRLPIKVDGQRVGTLVVYFNGMRGMFSRQDIDFRSAIARSIVWGGLISGILSALIGILLSHGLTLPMKRVTQAITDLADGNLEQRVPTDATDEPGRLAIAFNTMADRLKEQNYLRRKLTTDVSHELRTPLAAIQAHVEAFQDGVMEPDHKNLESVLEELQRLEQLVSDLSELSVAESGKIELKFEKLDLAEVTEHVVSIMYPLFRDKGIELQLKVSEQPIPIHADKRSLEKILRNLLSNALRYTDTGGQVTVVLSTDDHKAFLYVSDTGIGISEKDLPYIFERFYRTDSSRARKTGGTGVGLTIAKELVIAQGGDITVSSQVGTGSRFVVSLPLLNSSPGKSIIL